MSYILEALQKANAQRQQGGVPRLDGEHAPAALPLPPEVRRSWRWLAAGLTGVLLPVLLMWWWDRSQQPPKAIPATAVVPTPSVMPAPSLPTAESPPAMAEVQPAPPEPTESPMPVNSRVFEASGPILAAPSVLAAPPPSPSAQTPRTTSSGSAPMVPAGSASDTTGWTVSGSTYSDNPQHRMLIVNGQVVREGQELRPGLRLEAIGQRSAILNEGGRRFNLNY